MTKTSRLAGASKQPHVFNSFERLPPEDVFGYISTSLALATFNLIVTQNVLPRPA